MPKAYSKTRFQGTGVTEQQGQGSPVMTTVMTTQQTGLKAAMGVAPSLPGPVRWLTS